jgi:hypothetical protein
MMQLLGRLARLLRAVAEQLEPASPEYSHDPSLTARADAPSSPAAALDASLGAGGRRVTVEPAPAGTEPAFIHFDPEGQAVDRFRAREYLAQALRRYSPRARGQA